MSSIKYRPEEIRAMQQAYLMDMRFEHLRRMKVDIYSLCPVALVFEGGTVSTKPVLSDAQKGILKQLDEEWASIVEKDYPLLISLNPL